MWRPDSQEKQNCVHVFEVIYIALSAIVCHGMIKSLIVAGAEQSVIEREKCGVSGGSSIVDFIKST
jgi:hypothetical protein